MSFQTNNLILRAKGIPYSSAEDVENRADPEQLPQPVGGMHLRWFFEREVGFPLHGYYIFRRPHSRPKEKCLSTFSVDNAFSYSANRKRLGISGFGTFRCDSAIGHTVSSKNTELTLSSWYSLNFSVARALHENIVGSCFELNIGLHFSEDTNRSLVISVFHQEHLLEKRIIKTDNDGNIEALFAYDTITHFRIYPLAENTENALPPLGKVIIKKLCYFQVADSYVINNPEWEPLLSEDLAVSPICLPVSHPDYRCENRPADIDAAYELAEERVSYGNLQVTDYTFKESLHPTLEQLVATNDTPMADRLLAEEDRETELDDDIPGSATLESASLIDLVLTPTIHPGFAQALGLYFVDSSAQVEVPYDYLIIAAHNQALGDGYSYPLPPLNGEDVYLVHNVKIPSAKEEIKAVKPEEPVVYALPQGIAADPNEMAAALTWEPAPTSGVAGLDGVVLYNIWRFDLGNKIPDGAPNPEQYQLLNNEAPVIHVKKYASEDAALRPSDWPSGPLAYVDRKLACGWYSYRVSSIDMYGRHSELSEPMQWKQWLPKPKPVPRYYIDDIGDGRVRLPDAPNASEFAVKLIDEVPPPVPYALQSQFIDPDDPTLRFDENENEDAIVVNWLNQHSTGDAIRVKWSYPDDEVDCFEFRIYLHPGNFNAHTGLVSSVTTHRHNQRHLILELDDMTDFEVNDFSDCKLQVNRTRYNVVSGDLTSATNNPRVLVVEKNGLSAISNDDIAVLEIGAENDAYRIPADIESWQGNRFDNTVLYRGSSDDYRSITDSNNGNYRLYDVILSVEAGRFPANNPSGVSYASVGVSAADFSEDRLDILNDPDRPGNESKMGGPVKIYRVDREPPPQPQLKVYPDNRLFSSEPDYRQHSFFNFEIAQIANRARWMHIYRALDATLFNVDCHNRPPERRISSPDQQINIDDRFFPPEWLEDEDGNGETLSDRVVAELVEYYSISNKDDAREEFNNGISNNLRRLIAGFPENNTAFTQITSTPLNKSDMRVYIDTLVGRGKGVYFYRAAFLSASQVKGEWSLSTPPVYIPDTRPPSAPRIIKATGGDRQVTLRMQSVMKDKVFAYNVYRTSDPEAAKDLRLMGEPVTQITRSEENGWTEGNLAAPKDYYYRVTAIRKGLVETGEINIASLSNGAIRVRTYASGPPSPLSIQGGWINTNDGSGAIRLTWTSEQRFSSVAIQRRNHSFANWRTIARFNAYDDITFDDANVDATASYDYRLLGTDICGKRNRDFNILSVPARSEGE